MLHPTFSSTARIAARFFSSAVGTFSNDAIGLNAGADHIALLISTARPLSSALCGVRNVPLTPDASVHSTRHRVEGLRKVHPATPLLDDARHAHVERKVVQELAHRERRLRHPELPWAARARH